MNKKILMLAAFVNMAQAGTPVWTFNPLSSTYLAVSNNTTAVVIYTITNNSKKTRTLQMNQIQGITQDTSSGYCQNPLTLASNQSCTLKLNITGSQLSSDVLNGPVLCEQGKQGLQCYQPNSADSLKIYQNLLYDNGPLVNGPGQGANGYNASIVQENLGFIYFGTINNFNVNYVLADDFTVPSGKTWRIDTLNFFLFQGDSGLNSTINSVRYVIYDAPPTDLNKNIICGNLLVDANINLNQWSKIYRAPSSEPLYTRRPIMQVGVNSGGCVLYPGTYWLAWTSTGSTFLNTNTANPYITINGQTITGNALVSSNLGATWSSVAADSALQYPQGLPFILQGSAY